MGLRLLTTALRGGPGGRALGPGGGGAPGAPVGAPGATCGAPGAPGGGELLGGGVPRLTESWRASVGGCGVGGLLVVPGVEGPVCGDPLLGWRVDTGLELGCWVVVGCVAGGAVGGGLVGGPLVAGLAPWPRGTFSPVGLASQG